MVEAQKQRRWSIEGPDIKQGLFEGDPTLHQLSHIPLNGDADRERFTPQRTGLIGKVL